MDAISFVLGVRTAQLRGSLKELLYSNSDGTSEEDQPHKGYVKLIYCTDQNEQITFARHIQPSGAEVDGPYQSVYKINDRTVSWDAYCQKLSSFGILVKVRNFLVFQVVSAACLDPGCLLWYASRSILQDPLTQS
jgi:structural maintenance of chromosome 1